MKKILLHAFVILLITQSVSSSAIPIWELLTYEEKMGRLMYTYVHLVERYCKTSPSADCRKVMTLHGIANLLNYDEHTLDLLDPDQRNASILIWQAATKSQYKYPPEKSNDQESIKTSFGGESLQFDYSDNNDRPQSVVVPAPNFLRRRMWIH
ncbi:Rhythmically expressed 5 protein, partial [Stegodyphus mimosarum]